MQNKAGIVAVLLQHGNKTKVDLLTAAQLNHLDCSHLLQWLHQSLYQQLHEPFSMAYNTAGGSDSLPCCCCKEGSLILELCDSLQLLQTNVALAESLPPSSNPSS